MERISHHSQLDPQSPALSELPGKQTLPRWLLGKLTSSHYSSVRQKLQPPAPLWRSLLGMYHLPTLNPERLPSVGLPYVTRGVNFSSQELIPPTHLTVSGLGPSSVQPSVRGNHPQWSSLPLRECLLLGLYRPTPLFPQYKHRAWNMEACNR